MIKNNITDPRNNKKAHLHTPFVDETNPPNGLVVYTEPRRVFDGSLVFFTNPTQGVDMNVNGSSTGGSNEEVYNENHGGSPPTGGITEWDATNISGANFTFNSTTHAYAAYVTIIDYSIIDNIDSVTINGTNITNTTLTAGGTDWTAATSNAATATSLASAIDGVTGVSASSTNAVVTVLSDTGSDITTFTTTGDAGELIASALSINATATTNNNSMQLDRDAGTIVLSNFVSLSGWIYITAWSTGGSLKEVEVEVRTAGILTGNLVNLSTYISTVTFNTWQNFTIPLSDLGLSGQSIDQVVFRTRDLGGGPPPNYFLDYIQWSAISGSALGPTAYTIRPSGEEVAYVDKLRITMVDAFTGFVTVSGSTQNATMPALPYNALLGLPALTTGLNIRATRRGEIAFNSNIKQLSDFLQLPDVELSHFGSDGTNTWMTIDLTFRPNPLPLSPNFDDNITVTINDNMSDLLLFRMSARLLEEKTS